MVGPSSGSSSLKEYLKRYQDPSVEEQKKKKKKKKVKPVNSGVSVVDEDPVWQKEVKMEEEDNDSADEEKPQVDEDIEVKRMKRLEQLKARRPFGVISEDGSGWVSVSNTPNISPPRRRRADTPPEHDVDLSPPHKQRARNDTPSPEHGGDVDLSPRRKRRARNDTPSPEHGRDVDLSPPRKRRARNDTPSPEHGGDVDLSPPRKQRARNDTPSPEHGRDGDLSPPRKRRAQNDTPSLERGRDGDLSPPRKRRARNDIPSPDRELRPSSTAEADLLPPRRRTARDSPSLEPSSNPIAPHYDLSPPRRVRRNYLHASPAPDLSPQRKGRKDGNDTASASSLLDLSPPRKVEKKSPTPRERPKTGLVTGKEIKQEIAKTKKEEWLRFKEMDPSISGRGAEPVYRDKVTGERISKEELLKSQKKEEKPKEIKLEWGKGLAQKRETEARLQELESEKDKPFARDRDDPELDRMLKERVRWGDPMSHLVKKKQLEPVFEDLGNNEKMKESGFVIPQEIPKHSWITRGLDAPTNRYGIKPGRHWDGVDRSNGFEKQMFKRMNEKQATEREAYLWSVSDMTIFTYSMDPTTLVTSSIATQGFGLGSNFYGTPSGPFSTDRLMNVFFEIL
ncbi:hypothetical protein ACH5RR_024391 [Cinchona calisaya]|uniref:BUD13 homolog n=1 Tax=Cinchona calisaya TaxID=153742 RepID=A0ABD2YZA3_9GENT